MHNNDPIYQWSDAWLLLAIIYASQNGTPTLAKVIATGDAINHAIFTPTELERGLARLSRGGYVGGHEGIFGPLEKAFEYEGSDRKNRVMLKEWKAVEKMLNARELGNGPTVDSEPNYPKFTIADYEEAIEEYRREVERCS
jgi:hypothetical protein